MDLFEAGQDEVSLEPSLNVNKQFAEKYEAKKRREELSKRELLYGMIENPPSRECQFFLFRLYRTAGRATSDTWTCTDAVTLTIYAVIFSPG